MTTTQRFEFDWDLLYRPAALALGITPWTAYVEVTPSELSVRFGLWSLRSAVGNIVSAEVSEDFAFLKTAGPPHLSLADRGVTFATNGRRGVCLRFRYPVHGIDPTKTIRHPGATLTVRDVDGLRAAVGFDVPSTGV